MVYFILLLDLVNLHLTLKLNILCTEIIMCVDVEIYIH